MPFSSPAGSLQVAHVLDVEPVSSYGDVKAGDYVVRGDQPFRTLADMYFSIQNYAPQNPSPYDDTGWTFQYMRDLKILPVRRRAFSISR